MNEQTMSEALDIIHDKALQLLKYDSPPEVRKGLELIMALARYKFDVRSKPDREEMENK